MPLHLLIVASETAPQREARRAQVGAASHETYAQTLRSLEGECSIAHVNCVDEPDAMDEARLRGFDGVFLAGSPIQMHEDGPETRDAARFMRRVFDAGTPAFGSCAGLQIAAVAAGGSCRPRAHVMEAGFARGIVATPEGQTHPLLAGRSLAWSAPAMHSSMVDRLPEGGRALARTRETPVEAAEIRSGNSVFWGVQYHPELTLAEIAASLRRQAGDLVAQHLARSEGAVGTYADALDALSREPDRRDLHWQLGLDEDVTDPARRMVELSNFLAHLRQRRA